MTKEQLENILFGDRLLVYAILDGASVPDLPTRLFEMDPPNYCLFRGELEPDMAAVAPYVVALLPGSNFTEWVLKECYGKHWGIFLQSKHSIKEMRGHLRGLITVFNEDGNPMIFRYYDPRVITKFLPTCTDEELKEFFGDIERFFAELTDDKKMISYELDNGSLKEKEIE